MSSCNDQSIYAVRFGPINFLRNIFGCEGTKNGQARQWRAAQQRRRQSHDRRNDRYI